MHANIGAVTADSVPAKARRERLISIPYLLLRASTAGGALAMGFVQTFVFARVLAPEEFAVFIVVGAIGYTLWFTDLGLAKILFVNLRAAHLAGRRDEAVARQATAVIAFYVALAVGASLVCFPIAYFKTGAAAREASDFALFLLYITLNLGWFSLRTLSIAVDCFVPFERLELVRRTVNIVSLLSMLAGLPLTLFLAGSNLLWAVLFAVATTRLIQRGALIPSLRDAPRDLVGFFRSNWHAVSRSSAGALSGLFVATFPYYFVSLMYGLGSAPIILEVTFRIFRGACVIFAAICDLAIPGQTRAMAARDRGRLIKTTLLAVALCCVPAVIGSALLVFAGGPLFKFILHTAATVPPGVVPVLVVLLMASVVQIVAEALLQYSGFFRSLAINGIGVVLGMVAVTALAAILRWDIVAFLAAYSVVYAAGAAWLGLAAIFGPVRAASESPRPAGVAKPAPV